MLGLPSAGTHMLYTGYRFTTLDYSLYGVEHCLFDVCLALFCLPNVGFGFLFYGEFFLLLLHTIKVVSEIDSNMNSQIYMSLCRPNCTPIS